MRRAAGQAEVPGEQVPQNGGSDGCQQHSDIDGGGDGDLVADGVGHSDAENERAAELRHGGHGQGDARRKGARGNHGCHDIARIVDAVEEVKPQGEDDEDNEQGGHARSIPRVR